MSLLMVPRAPITNGNFFVLIGPTFVQPSRFPSIIIIIIIIITTTTTREVEVETYSTAAKSLTCALKLVLWHAIVGKSTNKPTCQNLNLQM